MSTRVHSLTVVLSMDFKGDDLTEIIKAIGMVKGVSSVRTHVSDHVSYMAEQRAKIDLRNKLYDIFDDYSMPSKSKK